MTARSVATPRDPRATCWPVSSLCWPAVARPYFELGGELMAQEPTHRDMIFAVQEHKRIHDADLDMRGMALEYAIRAAAAAANAGNWSYASPVNILKAAREFHAFLTGDKPDEPLHLLRKTPDAADLQDRARTGVSSDLRMRGSDGMGASD